VKQYCAIAWRGIRWTAFAVVILACAGGIYLYHNLNNEIRTYVENRFASHYSDLQVTVRSARLIDGVGIEIRGLSFSERSSSYQAQEIVTVDEILVYCSTDAQALSEGRVRVERIVAKRPRIVATIDDQGKTNLEKLFPFPKWGNDNPAIYIGDGSLFLADRKGRSTRRVLEDIDVQIRTEMAADGSAQKQVRATIKNQGWETATLTAVVDEAQKSFAIQGSIANARIEQSTWDQLPDAWRAHLLPLAHLKAVGNVNLSAAGTGAKLTSYQATIDLRNGTWSDPRLPGTIEKIQARIVADSNGIRVDPLVAHHQSGLVRGSIVRSGWSKNSPMQVSAELTNFSLNSGLAGLLPAGMQRSWNRYRPSGPLDAMVRFDFDGQRWTPEIHANCRGTNFVFEKFPYPVRETTGSIHFKNRKLDLDLLAKAGSSKISINGQVTDPGPDNTGTIRVKTLDPVRWDSTLESALEVAQQDVCNALRMFHINGLAYFDFAITSKGQDIEPDKSLRIDVVDASVRYEKFPYPISKISGPIIWENNTVRIDHIQGVNDSGHITCWGNWKEVPGDHRGQLAVQFTCKDVALDNELKSSLPESAQEGWDQLRPRGSIDHVDVDLKWPNQVGQADLTVVARKGERQRNLSGRAVSVEPLGFPYVMDEVTGTVEFRDGQISMHQLHARHGDVRIATNGYCHFPEDRRWAIQFESMQVENISFDRDLLIAVPPDLEQALRALQIGPLLHAQGDVRLSNPNPGRPLAIQWDIATQVAGARLGRGDTIDNVFGEIRFQGVADEDGARTAGEYFLDSLTHNGIPISDVRGPFWIDQSQFLSGWHVPRNQDQAPRHVSAKSFGGTISLDGRMALAGDRPFQVQIALASGTIGQMLIDLGQPNKAQTSGRIYGNLLLNGTMQGSHTYDGRGSLQVREANLYQLPLAVAMLNVLNARFPNTNAFNSADINYRVSGDYVYLDDLKLSGETISLRGKGEAHIDGQINMRFYTELANQSLNVPVIRQVLGNASRSLMVINVDGTIDNPQTTQEVFPLVNETLEQLFPATPIGFSGVPGTGNGSGMDAFRRPRSPQ